MNITLRHLRAFVTIARLSSFVEASRSLHVTQAALSNVIRDLEQAVGVRLLDRTTRRVRLSEAGRQFMPRAEAVLAAMQEAERCATDLCNYQSGVVRIAATQAVAWTVMPAPLAAFRRAHPGVRVLPADVPVDDIRASVDSGVADLAISNRAPVEAHIEGLPLFRSRIQVVCPPGHRFAARSSVRWSEVMKEPLIFTGRESLMRLRAELDPSFEPSDVHEVGNTAAALGLVAAGLGIAVCPGYVAPMTGVHGLAMVRCTSPAIVRQYLLFTNRQRTLSPAARLYKAFLLDYFARDRGCIEDRSSFGARGVPEWSGQP